MKRLILVATASIIALSGAAQADHPRKDNNHRGHAVHEAPGQVKKQELRREAPKPSARRFAPGQRMPKGYRTIENYRHYGLPHPGRGHRYVRHDDHVYKISAETATVVALIGVLSALR